MLFRLAYDRGNDRLWTRLRRLRRANARACARLLNGSRGLLGPRRFHPALRALRRNPRRPGGGRRAMLRTPRARGGRPDRGVPRAGAGLRARARALAAGLSALARGRRHRGQARFRRAAARRGAHPDRARRQGSRSAGGLSARYDAAARRPGAACLWSEADGLPLWRPRGDLAAPFYRAERRGAAPRANCRNTAACFMSR